METTTATFTMTSTFVRVTSASSTSSTSSSLASPTSANKSSAIDTLTKIPPQLWAIVNTVVIAAIVVGSLLLLGFGGYFIYKRVKAIKNQPREEIPLLERITAAVTPLENLGQDVGARDTRAVKDGRSALLPNDNTDETTLVADPVADPATDPATAPTTVPMTAAESSRTPPAVSADGDASVRTYVKGLVKDPSKGSAISTMVRNVFHGLKEAFKGAKSVGE